MSSNQESLRFRVYKFYTKHIDQGKSFTVHHFKDEGESNATIYRILNRYENGLAAKRKSGSGRKAKIFTKKNLKKLEAMFENKDQVSIRLAARKFNASKSLVHKMLATKTKIRHRKKQSIPARNDGQIESAKTKCDQMRRKLTNRDFILDDESYFTFSCSNLTGLDGFYTSNLSSAPNEVRYAKKKKFEQKVLVWLAISPRGISQPFICNSGLAINADRYLNECIKRKLIPFIKSHYQDGRYVFWPDQASSHYAKTVLEHLRSENIDFVEKKVNPANVPEVRPIEDFWAILKRKVYAKGWEAKSHQQLKNRIRYCLRNIDASAVQRLAQKAKARIRKVAYYGVIEKR